jgi:ubiquinone/menaquinone biosynthesis C-methylase UbiE
MPKRQAHDRAVEQHDLEAQRLVNAHFEATSAFWTQVYRGRDVLSLIVQRRRDIALAWVDELQLPAQSRILEVGCGAGVMAVELARKGFEVDATDTVTEMLELTQRRGEEANVAARLRTFVNDVHAIDFDGETFDLVIALGVIPWLHSPQAAVNEIARVLKPGAHFIISANNAARLTHLVDPRYNPALRPLRKAVKRLLERLRVLRARGGDVPARLHSPREFDGLLAAAGLAKVKGMTLGFGPFTFLGHRFLPARLEPGLHHWLQVRAEQGISALRSRGTQYLVLACKVATAA